MTDVYNLKSTRSSKMSVTVVPEIWDQLKVDGATPIIQCNPLYQTIGCILIWNIAIAPTNCNLLACTKFHQYIWSFTLVVASHGRTDVNQNSTCLVSLIIYIHEYVYITKYLSRWILGDTKHRNVNKTFNKNITVLRSCIKTAHLG